MSKFEDEDKIYTRLQSACSGESADQVYLLAINHDMISPNESAISVLIRAEISTQGLQLVKLLEGDEIFDYSAKFNCLERLANGEIFIGEGNGLVSYKNTKARKITLRKYVISSYKSETEVLFGTYGGEIIHLNINEPEKSLVESIGEESIDRIHGINSDFIVAVGNNGFVARFDQGKWEKIASPSNTRLEAVWCKSKKEIYIAGWEGSAWRWDGDGHWEPLHIDFDGDVNKFRFSDFVEYQGILYSANSKNGIYKLVDNKFISVPKIKNECVARLSLTTAGIIGLGALWGEIGGWFTHFNGTKWSAEKISISA